MKRILIHLILISFFLVFAWYCTSDSNQRQPKYALDASTNLPDNKPLAQQTEPKPDSPGEMFYNTKPFKILSLKNEVTLQYTGPDDTTKCKNWRLTSNELSSIIKNSQPIDGTYWDLGFAFTTCEINGQLMQDGKLFNYSLNGGSWFHISCRDTVLLFGDLKKSHRKYFLAAPN